MKFSTKRKREMRKIRLKRNQKAYGSCIGCYVEGDNEVVDTLTFTNNLYLLTIGDRCKIFKVVSCHELVELSNKKILNMRAVFENSTRWKKHTKIELTNSGAIKTYTPAPEPWEKIAGRIVIFVET